jgi:hypothetical protein
MASGEVERRRSAGDAEREAFLAAFGGGLRLLEWLADRAFLY